MRFTRPIITLVCALILTGCGSGGLLNLNPQPDGNIVITNSQTSAVLQTTLAAPFIVAGGGFSIGITESHFSGPFTVTISSWTAPFSLSCFVPHYIDQSNATNVVQFSADNAAPVATPTQPSPCNSFIAANGATQTDEETAQITDGKGHATTFYYQRAGATAGTGGGTGGGSPSAARLAISWSGASPTATACGAYVLNVGAVSASGTAVPTTAANPITLSTTGGGYMGFSASTAAAAFRRRTAHQNPANAAVRSGHRNPSDAAFACTGTPPVGSPGGAATLQVATGPAQVLVYFNGYSAAALTTVTANSVGLPPVALTISIGSPTTAPANLVTSWSGPSPTGSECGAYVLNVGAVTTSGTPVPTTAANPITLTTTGGGYMGFDIAGAASAAFTCTGNPPVGSPGGSPSLQLSATPAQVLVYFNGFSAAASTTITASSVSTAPTAVAIASAVSTTVASIQLVWNSPVLPKPANCGAFVLNVIAKDVNGKVIVSAKYSNPITLSTNGAFWQGFSTVVAGIAPAPPPSALVCVPPPGEAPSVGTPTLAVPDTATPTVVYYDGPYDGGAQTTITATAVGVPSVSDGVIMF